MPRHYDEHYEQYEQDWEVIKFTKSSKPKINSNVEKSLSEKSLSEKSLSEKSLSEKIFSARKKAKLTAHELSQLLHITIKLYMKFESGEEIPNSSMINKLKKFIPIEYKW